MTSRSKNSIIAFHQKLIDRHGAACATGFSEARQRARFEVMLRAIQSLDAPIGLILDYGCNVGDFLRFLVYHKSVHTPFQYTGIDLNHEFIVVAKQRSVGKFYCADILEPKGKSIVNKLAPNIIVSSGVFCYPARKRTNQRLLNALYASAKSAVIVNFLSAEKPPGIGNLVRYKPEEIIEMARKCGCKAFELWHSYLDNDMTLILRKKFSHQ